VKVNDPKPNFSITHNLYNSPIQFIDETTGGEALAYPNGHYWDFGDPASGYNNYSQQKSPTHTYNAVGNYTIKLIVTTEGGCRDTISKTIFIDSIIKPIANYSAETFNPYFGKPTKFLDISDYNPTFWRWEVSPATVQYHDNTNKFSQNPVISFNNTGVYAVRLFASNNAGADSTTRVITVKNYVKPVAEFSADPLTVKAGQVITFLDESLNDPISWTWSFGDSDSSSEQHPTKSYNNTGTYNISMTATNPSGSDTKVKSNYIKVTNEYNMCDNEAPFSNLFNGLIYDSGGRNGDYKDGSNCGFLIKPDCAGPVTLTFTEFDMQANDYIYIYDGEDENGILLTPDGLTGSTKPSPIKASSGAMYIVEYTNIDNQVSSGFRAYWTALQNITPLAQIDADTIGYLNGPVRFTNKTSLGTGNTIYWDFQNDNVYDQIYTPKDAIKDGVHAFKSLGYKTVKLKAENCAGKDSTTHLIHIIYPVSPPVADFKVLNDTIVAEEEKVHFIDLSSMGPTSWKWNITWQDYFSYAAFTNGTTDTSQNPVIQFYGIDEFDISLTASNMIGTSTKTTKKKYIRTIRQVWMGRWPYEYDDAVGKVYDSGGEDGNYQDNENHSVLIKPCAEVVYLTFEKFYFAAGDFLRVYDGIDKNGDPLFPGTGFTSTQNPPATPLIAKSGAVFIEMVSNNTSNAQGFVARWTIDPKPVPSAYFTSPDTAFTGGHVLLFENKSTGVDIQKFYWDYDFNKVYDDSTLHGKFKYTKTGYTFAVLKAVNCSGEGSYSKMIQVLSLTKKPVANNDADVKRVDT